MRAGVARGRLVKAFHGVYIVGDPELLPLARESAALLSLGPSSLLSHRSAAAVWGFAAKADETVHVTVIDTNPRTRAGVRIHHVARLPALLRHLLGTDRGTTYTRSKAERLLRRLLKAAGLPQPIVNVPLLGYTADFLWREHRLILEVDGYPSHGHKLAFERDRRRDQVHVAAGYTVIRVTWHQLVNEPYGVIARIAQALALRRAA